MIIKYVRNIARFIIGAVFIFSGFVKAIDPWGSAFKFYDYFEAFGMDFLMPLTLVFAIILSTSELLIGLNLFFKIRMKETAWALFIFMAFFTILTLILAITNPVTDCGCFGDALILTNWQTFFKNLIFLVPTLIVFQQRKLYEKGFASIIEWSASGVFAIIVVLLSVYCLRNLPLMDFRPYKIGANIPKLMEIPEGMPTDEYETVMIYEKNGIQKEFTLNSPEKPWSDTTWKWIETRNRLISKGYVPPIHDFSLVSPDGEDITGGLLSDSGYSFLIVSSNVKKINPKGLKIINEFASRALEEGYRVYGMTSSTQQVIEEATGQVQLAFTFYTTDEITLKTIIRSNPGLLLIKEGVVLGKWHFRNVPLLENLKTYGALSYSLVSLHKERSDGIAYIVILLIGFMASLLYHFRSGK